MSLEWIAAGVLVCLFGMIALMPSFDGKWDAWRYFRRAEPET